MKDEERINQCINYLKKSPIFAMSLGSKELFHSNFWAFLMEQEETKSFINCFFPNLDLYQIKEIKREDKHRDLVIFDKNDNEYVIENKIKSYPRKEQLEGYQTKVFKSGVITGINPPPFELKSWRFVSYSDISTYLKGISKNLEGFKKEIIVEYYKVLDAINEILSLCLKETTGKLSFWTENIDKLKEIRLMDVYRKIKADDYIVNGFASLKDEFETKVRAFDNIKFYIERSFNNGKATLTFGLNKIALKNNEALVSVGVQIEDNQFRLFVWDKNCNADECFNKYTKANWFDDKFDIDNHRYIHDKLTKMSKKYCQYGYNWIYQYFDTWFEESNEVKQDIQDYNVINNLIKEQLVKALNILK